MKLSSKAMTAGAIRAAAAGYVLALLVLAQPAAGQVPAPRTVANPVRALAAGNAVGELTFRATFDAATASASVEPIQVRLPAGTYKIETCVSAKAAGAAPEASCEKAEARVNLLTTLTSVTTPGARMTVRRPAAGQPPATIAGRVIVYVNQGGGTFGVYASSWPAGGLPAAGIAVPAVDQVTAGLVLGPQGVVAPGIPAGAINSGSQDSICEEEQLAGGPALEGSTSALGALPFDYEVQEPTGGAPLRGVMLVIHGGAWSIVGRPSLAALRPDADRWRARGWRTINTTYRACGASIEDVLTLYDRARSRYGRALPICAWGESAGGHLTLLLAALRPELACATVIAGPSDLTTLAGQATPADPLGAIRSANFAVAAFGADRLAQISPTRLAVHARVLYGIGVDDLLVPWEQATDFAAAQRRRDPAAYVDTLRVEPGDIPFGHTAASKRGVDEFYAHEERLVAPLIIGGVTAPPRARLATLRGGGLRVPFTCSRRCTVTARLELGASAARRAGLTRVVGRGSASRTSRGRGTLTVRLSKRARGKLAAGTLQLVSDITAGKTRRRQTASIAVRS